MLTRHNRFPKWAFIFITAVFLAFVVQLTVGPERWLWFAFTPALADALDVSDFHISPRRLLPPLLQHARIVLLRHVFGEDGWEAKVPRPLPRGWCGWKSGIYGDGWQPLGAGLCMDRRRAIDSMKYIRSLSGGYIEFLNAVQKR